MLKVLISGGGIAGNALAFWLTRIGHSVTVVERFPALRATGLQLDLRGHGIEVMKRMGLEQAFRARTAPEQGLQVVGGGGRQWAIFPPNKSGKGLQGFTTDYEIMRGDLCSIMHDAASSNKPAAKYVFGTSIEHMSYDTPDGVDVRFANGETGRFDLVVGADGQHSRTRTMLFGPGSSNGLVPLKGSYYGYYTIARPMADGEDYLATMYYATGGRSIMTRRHSPHAMQVYLMSTVGSERLERARPGDVAEEKAAMAEHFSGAGWKTEELLEDLRTSDDFYCERLGVVKLESWSRGRVTLVGDAAYCPSANTGMGTTSGMVGAYILAGEIGNHCGGGSSSNGVVAALEAYERRFRPFMEQVQRGIVEEAEKKGMFSSSQLGVTLFNLTMAAASLLKIDIIGRYFLREGVKDWELPDYDMVRK